MIDLQQFCSTEETRRKELGEPWSFGGYSYASNGHIMIRVSLRSDIPEREAAPNAKAERLFTAYFNFGGPFTLARHIPLPDGPRIPCGKCDGRGKVHACPACSCACAACAGAGSTMDDSALSVGLRGATFDGKYARKIAELPNLRLPMEAANSSDPMPFVFGGGHGLLMPFRGAKAVHVMEQSA